MASVDPILVIEDDTAAIRLIEEAFTEINQSVEVVIATDGVEAFDYIHSRGEYEGSPPPGLVLLDLGLPGQSGQEILAEIRAESLLETVPIVVLSATDDPETIAECYEIGATAYIVKPDAYETLLAKLAALVEFWTATVEPPPS